MAPMLQAALAKFAKPWYRRRSLRIFRDETTLEMTPALWPAIQKALLESQYFILLASPEAAASKWVKDELAFWFDQKRHDRLMIVLTGGEITWQSDLRRFDWDKTTALPASIFDKVREQPLYVDLSWIRNQDQLAKQDPRFTQCVARLYSKITATALDDVIGEDVRQQKKTKQAVFWTVATIMLLAALTIWFAWVTRKEGKIVTASSEQIQQDRYFSNVTFAESSIENGNYYKARSLLLSAPQVCRDWEWWYLMARCGPAPVGAADVVALNDSQIDQAITALSAKIQANSASYDGTTQPFSIEQSVESPGIVLDYAGYKGRSGTYLEINCKDAKQPALLNAFYTGMYGDILAASLDIKGCFLWNFQCSVDAPEVTSQLQSGDVIDQNGTYLAGLRERYVVDSPEKKPDNDSSDDQMSNAALWRDSILQQNTAHLLFDNENPEICYFRKEVFGDDADKILSAKLSLSESSITLSEMPDSKPSWTESPSLSKLSASTRETLQKEAQEHRDEVQDGYTATVYQGQSGPIVLSEWGDGNLRLRDGLSGNVIGESIHDPPSKDYEGRDSYGGRVTVLAGTNYVAGVLYWNGRCLTGVVDLGNKKIIQSFSDDDASQLDYAYNVVSGVHCSPDGSEMVFELWGRNEHEFNVWNIHDGRLVCSDSPPGNNGQADQNKLKQTQTLSTHAGRIRLEYGRNYLAICRVDGLTELRKSFADPPFTIIDGVVAPRGRNVDLLPFRHLAGSARALIGNVVVDTKTWSSVIALPPVSAISPDAETAVIESRDGILDVVRLGFRHLANESIPAANLTECEKLMWWQIHDHDASHPVNR